MVQQVREAAHFQVLKQHDPKLYELARGVRDHVMADGALSAKVKSLMAVLSDALANRFEAVPVLANVAREQGATDEEIAETIAVAFWLGGVHALSTASRALQK